MKNMPSNGWTDDTGIRTFSAHAEDQPWPKGGPDYLYVKPLKKPQHHGVFDEGMKCLDCHRMTEWTHTPPPPWPLKDCAGPCACTN